MTAPSPGSPLGDQAQTHSSSVLRDADTRRARRGYLAGAFICLVSAFGLQLAQGPAVLRWTSTVMVVVTGFCCGWLAWKRRDGSEFTDAEATIAGILMSLTALAAIAFVGPISATVTVLITLVMALAMGHARRGLRVFAVVAGGYAVLGVLTLIGAIAAVTPATNHPLGLVTGIVSVEVILAVSYWFGRAARRSLVAALDQAQRARFEIARQGALLNEARADLERLKHGSRVGRLSGQRVDGYLLRELIGRGGSAEVYRAHEVDSGREVALKVLNSHLAAEPTRVERFFREVGVASSLRSPHIVKVYGSGEAPDGSPYLAMELLDGVALAHRLHADGALDLDSVQTLVRQVAVALEDAHAAGIVHRDIKPGNIFFVERPQPIWKVVDFGVSKLLSGTGTLTGEGMIGTPGYMAPEQAYGRDVDARADVFALGAVAYRALTGQPPFPGPDVVSVLLQAARKQPKAPRALAKMPEDLELVLALALAKDRDERFGSAAELAASLQSACTNSLPNVLRERALALLSRAPWGSSTSDDEITRAMPSQPTAE